jgi:cytochrome P450
LGSFSAFRKDPLRLLTESAARYGDVVRCKLGPHVVHLLNHPAHIEHVLVKHSENYDRHTRSAGRVREACGDGLLSSNGALWKRERQLLQPVFNAPLFERAGLLTTESTARMFDAWQDTASRGMPIDIITEMRRLTCTIAAQAFFGSDVGKDSDTINQALDTLLDYIWTRLESALDCHRYLPTFTRRRFLKAVRSLDEIVYRIIAERRTNATSGHDLLCKLLASHGSQMYNTWSY